MSTDLEVDLTERLATIAELAPATSLRLADVTTRVDRRRRRRTVLRTTVAVAAVAGVGVGLLALQSARSTQPVTPSGSLEVPTESPLTVLPEAFLDTSVVKPGALALQMADGQRITFAITGSPFYDGYSQATTIRFDAYGTGRAQPAEDIPLIPEPELGGNNTVVFWTGIPAGATRVEFHAADGTVRWQQPVQGIAAFPVLSHAAGDRLVATDATGTEVAHADWTAVSVVGTSQMDEGPIETEYSSLGEPSGDGVYDVSKLAGLSQIQEDAYRSFGDDTMRACLAADGEGAWTACIRSTDAAVEAYLTDVQAQIATSTTG